jgi:hypothetical protein
MSEPANSRDWEGATWKGSRRLQIRRSLALTVRERLEALESLSESSFNVGKAFRSLDKPQEGTMDTAPSPRKKIDPEL